MVGASLASLLSASQPDSQIALIDINPLNEDAGNYQPSFDARATALAHGSAEIFQQLGIWSQLQQHLTPIRQVHVSDRGHFGGGVIDASEQHVDAVGYVIENTWLGNVLSTHVQQQKNITYFAPARVESLLPQPQGALLTVRTKADSCFKLNCTLAVIADGGESPMRRALGIASEVVDYHQTAIIANVAFSQPHKSVAYERFTAQGPLALLPLGGSPESQRAALVWTLPEQEAAQLMRGSDAEFLRTLQERFGQRLGRFVRVGLRYAYPLKLITAEEQIRSGLVLVGNAAHFLHPVAGQGFNLALRDCVSLTETLFEAQQQQKSIGELAVLQNYLQRQALDQLLTIQFSDRLVRTFSSSSLPLIALRHLGLISLAGLPTVKKVFAAHTMGTAGRQSRWRADASH